MVSVDEQRNGLRVLTDEHLSDEVENREDQHDVNLDRLKTVENPFHRHHGGD